MFYLAKKYYEYVKSCEDFDEDSDPYDSWLDSYDEEIDETPREFLQKLEKSGKVDEYAEACFARGWVLDESIIELLSDEKYMDFLIKNLYSSSDVTSRACAECLGNVGGALVDDAMLSFLVQSKESGKAQLYAYEYLSETDPSIVDKILTVIYSASPEIQQLLVEIMANYPDRKEVFMWLVTMLYRATDIPTAAKLIGRYGNEEGVKALQQFARTIDLSYDEYMEVRAAIEELGGEFDYEKDFTDDPIYRLVKNLPVEQTDDEVAEKEEKFDPQGDEDCDNDDCDDCDDD